MPAGDGSKVRANDGRPPRLAGEARRPVLPVYGYQKAFDRLLRDLWVEKAWPRQGRQKPVQRLFCSGAGCSDPGANRVF
jgi:hypothetical protein